MDAYIDPLYERCISDKEWANYIYFLKHLITDYDIQFINYLHFSTRFDNLCIYIHTSDSDHRIVNK